MIKKMNYKFLMLLLLVMATVAFSQYGKAYDGPDDPAGDKAAVRSAQLNGNRIFFLLNNNTSICDTGHGEAIWNRWPNDYSGFTMVHGINAVVSARVMMDPNLQEPVIDAAQISTRNDLVPLYFAQQGFRGRTDMDPTGTIEWGMKPVIDYINPLSEKMAMSNDSESWPIAGWPARGDETKWQGEWNGRFGRGVVYADLETYYVMNDAHDQEYLGVEDTLKYYPRGDLKIGDKDPNVTIQKGLPWGGLGLRMEIRGFQWNNPQARDAAFFEYTVANVSDYNLSEVCFGYYFHPYVGEDHGMTGDDYLFFSDELDMAYNWDRDGVSLTGLATGAFGMAYLESPAKPFDGLDNDNDGLIDEKRDNVAVDKIGPYDGIADLPAFLAAYNLKEEDLKEHWDADEDQDWMDGDDANNNGIYDLDEDPGDDIGIDGVAPGDINYTGPDADGSECNHKPDFLEGVGAEPNFAFTDVSESDMLGLTAFHTYDHESRPRIHQDDVAYWEYFSDSSFDPFQDAAGSWVNLFATGVFPLYKGRTERISMALIASFDKIESLNASEHLAPSLFRKKEITQIIYERDYRFAQPPKMPTLTATGGDGKVILTWDNVADQNTREPFLRNENDFEGYRVYKATDKYFSDAEVITNGYGVPAQKLAIFQCDKVDNRYGFADYGNVDGVTYYLGDDTGIQHYFVDTNVQNGKTYYYAVAAYDYGIPEIDVAPSENNIVLNLDSAEEVVNHGINVAIVTPKAPSAGHVPSEIEVLDKSFGNSVGTIMPQVLAAPSLQQDHTYRVNFSVDTLFYSKQDEIGLRYLCNGYSVFDETSNQVILSTVLDGEDAKNPPKYASRIDSLNGYSLDPYKTFETDHFDGVNLQMYLAKLNGADTLTIDHENTGWKVGNVSGNVFMNVKIDSANMDRYPWEYEIIFGDEDIYTTRTTKITSVRDEYGDKVDKNLLFEDASFNFYVLINTFVDTSGNNYLMDMVAMDADSNGVFELEHDKVLVGTMDTKGRWYKTLFSIDFMESNELPQPNDVYKMSFARPFFITDFYRFKVLPSKEDNSLIASNMDDIMVVPNPYVATNSMEPAVANRFLNQRRRIMFTHLPARCEIKIFTSSGILVQEIDVENDADNGVAYWDLETKENLEAAAGIYVYYVKATETGDEKIDKFAIIK